MATTGKAAPKPEDIDAQVAQIREDVAQLTKLLGDLAGTKVEAAKARAAGEAEALMGRAKARAEDARHRVEDAAGGLERYIEEKPLQSAMIALLAGLVIGILTRR